MRQRPIRPTASGNASGCLSVLATARGLDIDLLIEAAPALTRLLGARRNTLEQMLARLVRESFTGGASGPTEEQYARAIRRDVAIVREHFAATLGTRAGTTAV